MSITAAPLGLEQLGEHLRKQYDDECKLAGMKLRAIQTAFQGVPEEFGFKLARVVYYQVLGENIYRAVTNVIAELNIASTYFRWVEYPDYCVTVVDTKKYPFTIVFKAKFSLSEIRHGAEA